MLKPLRGSEKVTDAALELVSRRCLFKKVTALKSDQSCEFNAVIKDWCWPYWIWFKFNISTDSLARTKHFDRAVKSPLFALMED